jgi:hypothetical protein
MNMNLNVMEIINVELAEEEQLRLFVAGMAMCASANVLCFKRCLNIRKETMMKKLC